MNSPRTRIVQGLMVIGMLTTQSAMTFDFPDITIPLNPDAVWKPFGKQGIPISIIEDAKFPEVAKLKKIAVATFTGQPGVDFTASLRDELSSAVVNGDKVFELSATVNADGQRDTGSLVAQAKQAGLDAVYVGDTAIAGTQSTPMTEEYCEGGIMVFGKCQGGTKKTRACWNVIGTFTVNMQVIRAEDGNSVYEERKSESVEEKHCQASFSAPPNASLLALQAKDEIIAAIRSDIMPRTATHPVRLMSNTKSMPKEDKATFLEGKDWAEERRLSRACGIWEELSETSPNSAEHVSVIYNLGVCAEYQGDYQTAMSLYRKADSRIKPKSRDGKLPYAGIERVQSAEAATDR